MPEEHKFEARISNGERIIRVTATSSVIPEQCLELSNHLEYKGRRKDSKEAVFCEVGQVS